MVACSFPLFSATLLVGSILLWVGLENRLERHINRPFGLTLRAKQVLQELAQALGLKK